MGIYQLHRCLTPKSSGKTFFTTYPRKEEQKKIHGNRFRMRERKAQALPVSIAIYFWEKTSEAINSTSIRNGRGGASRARGERREAGGLRQREAYNMAADAPAALGRCTTPFAAAKDPRPPSVGTSVALAFHQRHANDPLLSSLRHECHRFDFRLAGRQRQITPLVKLEGAFPLFFSIISLESRSWSKRAKCATSIHRIN